MSRDFYLHIYIYINIKREDAKENFKFTGSSVRKKTNRYIRAWSNDSCLSLLKTCGRTNGSCTVHAVGAVRSLRDTSSTTFAHFCSGTAKIKRFVEVQV